MSPPTVTPPTRYQPLRPATIASLDDSRRETLLRAVSNVASCEAARLTVGQIAAGLPLSEVDKDTYDGTASDRHPLHTLHKTLCPQAVDRAERFRSTFDPRVLKFKPQLCREYQAAAPRSRAFSTRLIELVAASIHQIAALLHESDARADPDWTRDIKSWTAPEGDAVWWYTFPDGPPPTLLRHKWYCDYAQYPRGVADSVG
ncbi:hypothetical protein JDV02_003166 [Purpureocillium takamizusanense]|uniref:Uncharacterized protein n=1 Tax=Purpureocillium takamizusanense TaxID=2060973 RepID=A0A9Q8V8J9_9HYPO|nr:uncharacterized protein JDV02_003166 [Purpureocillium takamizusanense]UNI16758.1 hypothetical protein JDV02_003166 [Purpureocillium takamizusanense]